MKASGYVIDILGDLSDYSSLTSNTTLVTNNKYLVDTSVNSVILTLPYGNPKDEIVVFDKFNTFDQNNVILTSTEKIQGQDNDFIVDLKGLKLILIYVNSTEGWNIANLNSKFYKNTEIDPSGLVDNTVLQFNSITGKLEFVEYIERTETPLLSGPSTGTEQNDVVINITNYDSSYTYTIEVDGDSFNRTDGNITWTLPDVVNSETYNMIVKAQDTLSGYAVSESAVHSLLVNNLEPVIDDSLLVEGVSFNGFGEELNNVTESNKFIAASDNASVMTEPVLQDSGDNDFVKIEPKIKVSKPVEYLVDESSTVSTLKFTNSVPIEKSDKLYLINSDDSVDIMKNNIDNIVIENGDEITDMGSETVFNTGITNYISITKLDDTHLCIAYQDYNNSYYGTAIIGTISGNNITFGSETIFNPGDTDYISIITLDAIHVCIAYQDVGNSSYGTAIIGTISGTNITFGTETVFNTGTTYNTSITKLDDTHVCIAYTDYSNSSYGTAIIGTVNGNSITFGTETIFNAGDTDYISITKLDDTHVCIAYRDVSNSGYGTAIIGTISGNSITFGTETVFNSGNTNYIFVVKLDDTHVCIAYQDHDNSGYGTVIIGTISGNSITFGSKTVFNSGTTNYISIVKLDDTHVCIAYQDVSNSSYGTAIIGTISGNSIIFGTETVFNTGLIYYTSVVKLEDAHVCIAYRDQSNSDYGTAIMLERSYNSTLSLTNPLSEVPVKVFGEFSNLHTAIGTETEYIPSNNIELTDLTNVTTTGLTGSSTFDNLWVSDGYHDKIGLIVNDNYVETNVLSVNKYGSGPYTYDITYAVQTHIPTKAYKPAIFKGGYEIPFISATTSSITTNEELDYNAIKEKDKFDLVVNNTLVEDVVITDITINGSDITYSFATQTIAPTSASFVSTELVPENITIIDPTLIEVSYPEFDFNTISNIRQLKFFMDFDKLGDEWTYLYSVLYKKS